MTTYFAHFDFTAESSALEAEACVALNDRNAALDIETIKGACMLNAATAELFSTDPMAIVKVGTVNADGVVRFRKIAA